MRAAERCADRNAEGLRKSCDLRQRRLVPAPAAQNEHGTLALRQQSFQRRHLPDSGHGFRRFHKGHIRRLRGQRQHVMGQRQHHRAAAPGQRGAKGAANHLAHAVGFVHFRHPFGHAAKESAIIHLLKGVAAAIVPLDLAHEQDHGRGILLGDMNAARRVGGAGAAGDKADAGPPRLLAIGFRHHRRAAFIAARRDGDTAVVQRVQHRQIGFARHAEDMTHALDAQLVHQHLCGGGALGVHIHSNKALSV